MRKRLAILSGLTLALFTLLAVAAASAPPAGSLPRADAALPAGHGPLAPAAVLAQTGNAYIHLSTGATPGNLGNTIGDSTYLDNLTLNANSAARFLTINLRAPYSDSLPANNHVTGVWYNSGSQQWAIYNEDLLTMTHPLAWNVFVPPADDTLIVHVSSSGNISGSQTFIDSPQLNNVPGAIIFVQHVYNPVISGSPAVVPNSYSRTVTVAYSPARQKWAIMNADGSNFPTGIAFYVLKASPDEVAFQHTSSAANRLAPSGTLLDNPFINGIPDAEILVTQNFGTGVTNKADNQPLDVTYDPASGHWAVENAAGGPLADGLLFNVLVIPPKTGFLVHTVSETASSHSVLDHPDLNNNPYARIYVMHSYNPPEAAAPNLNDHPIGVFYSTVDNHWYLYNRDFSPLVHGSTFNVYYTWPRGNSFTASSNAINNDTGHYLLLNNPLLDSHPQALAQISYNHDPNGIGTNVNYTPTTGLTYNATPQAWAVFNPAGPNFDHDTSYNVLVPPANSFVVTATALNSEANHLHIDNPLTNGNRSALVFVSPHDHFGISDKNVGVYWDGAGWAIFNENTSDAMPLNVAFNVFVIQRHSLFLPTTQK